MKLFAAETIPEGGMFPNALLWVCDVNCTAGGVDEQSVIGGIQIPIPWKVKYTDWAYDREATLEYCCLCLSVRKTDIVVDNSRYIHDLQFGKWLRKMND